MGFSDLSWPKDTQLFPKHSQVLSYLQKHAEEVLHLVNFNTQVQSVRQDQAGTWKVTTQKISQISQEVQEETFDAVIVGNGHYDVPKLPNVAGIETFNAAYPSIITHSKFYRVPEVYTGKKVIIVGNSASGIDIGSQIATVCALPLLQSQKSESYLKVGDGSPSIVEKPEIIEYMLQDRTVRFADGSMESEVDAIVYCTGYFYSFPFLDSLSPPVITTGERVVNTYQHIFYQHNPTLAFLALNQKVIPFPWAEAQAAVIARVFSGRLSLPDVEEMKAWEDGLVAEMGTGTNFHVLKFPKDAAAINMMHDWAMSADGEGGKEPGLWGEEQWWVRERFPKIKKAFAELGENRQEARTLEDVGFSFEERNRSE
jgi:cation diffusion facilitator CzcD-associated flavoprotein CzcO